MENQSNLITAKQLLGSMTERIQVFCLLINLQAFKMPVFYNPSVFFTVYVKCYIFEAKRSKQYNPAEVN